MAKSLLEMIDITKLFPGVRALSNVNLTVEEGEVHAIVGENGAGKSTLMNVLSGIYPFGTYEGQILYDGEECRFRVIRDSEKKGIVIIHQELALVPYLSIGENIFLGNEQHTTGFIDWDATYHNADKLLRKVGLNESSRTLIKDIGVGKQQLVEIAKALGKNVRLLILDEPTASLNDVDSRKLLDLILDLKKNGITSIIISHKLDEISYVADKITIIRDGLTIETLDKATDDISEPRIVRGMVGREMVDRFPKREPNIGSECLRIEDWTVRHPLFTDRLVVQDASLNVRRGEIVGLAGLMGAGRTELATSVFGRAYGTVLKGRIFKDGQPIILTSISKAIQHGIAYITEDRKGDGLVLPVSISENISLAKLSKVSKKYFLDKDLEKNVAKDYRDRLSIKTPSVNQLVGNLSGGNQQKVLVSKWMFTDPEVLFLDEPTRGIDVGAKYEIYCIMNDLVASGKAVIMISSDLQEILGMCDRIYVMYEGKIIGELPRAEASQEKIMSMILSASKGA
ncbi:MAG: ATP-binding cassette domain-containing protein [Clostridiaceae bacterium]|nr:ATP-binding cassette domain-containing protein [Clostridiaceae bacterium]